MGGEWAVRDKHANNEHTGSYQDNIVQIVHGPHYSGLRLRNHGRGRMLAPLARPHWAGVV